MDVTDDIVIPITDDLIDRCTRAAWDVVDGGIYDDAPPEYQEHARRFTRAVLEEAFGAALEPAAPECDHDWVDARNAHAMLSGRAADRSDHGRVQRVQGRAVDQGEGR